MPVSLELKAVGTLQGLDLHNLTSISQPDGVADSPCVFCRPTFAHLKAGTFTNRVSRHGADGTLGKSSTPPKVKISPSSRTPPLQSHGWIQHQSKS